MSEEDKLKEQRKNAKFRFSLAKKKLDGSMALGSDASILQSQAKLLEEAYDVLVLSDFEYLEAFPQ